MDLGGQTINFVDFEITNQSENIKTDQPLFFRLPKRVTLNYLKSFQIEKFEIQKDI